MQIWYFEDCFNSGAEGLFDIPEPFCPSHYECEEMAEFCLYCGHPKYSSYRQQMPYVIVDEEEIIAQKCHGRDLSFNAAITEAFWQDYSTVKNKIDTLLLALELFRQRQYSSQESKDFLLEEYRNIIRLLGNLQEYIWLASTAKLRY